MNRKQYGLILVLSMVVGVMGSIASTRFLSGPLMSTQKTPEQAEIIRAEGSATLGLANSDRKATISLTMRADGNPSLDLTDQDGKPRATVGYAELEVSPGRITDKLPVFSVVLSDPSGRVIWKAP